MARLRYYLQPFTFILSIILSFSTQGQKITGSLSGDILDPSGAAISGAKITIRNAGTDQTREVLSTERGSFMADFLTPATYDVTVEHPGFKRKIFQGVTIEVNQAAALSVTLDIGDVVQEVAVQAAAPLMQTSESSVNSTISYRQVQDLPLNGRQFLQLALLIPGAVNSAPGSRQSSERGTASSALNVNGNREGSNLFLIDGSLNTDANFNGFVINPNVDSILEFKVQTNSYSSEFGQQAGAQINLVTRSGTNQYHGSAYEFLRNSALDAKNLFDQPSPAKIPPFRQNQYGATFGGPIKKEKLFIFGSWEGFRETKAQTSIAIVPDARIRTGDFSGRVNSAGQFTPIYDPGTTALNPAFNSALPVSTSNPQYLRSPFPGNIIPASRIDPIATGVLKYVDLPNLATLPFDEGQYLNNTPLTENNDQFSVRADYSLSQKDQIFGRYSWSKESLFQPGALSTQGVFRDPRPQIVTLGYTHTFTPSLLNDLRLGFTRLNLKILNRNAYTTNIPSALGIVGQQGLPAQAWDVPNISFTTEGLSTFGGSNFGVPTITKDNAYQAQDTVSITKGTHDLRMGFQVTRFQLNNGTLNYILPSYGYTSTPYTADVTNPTGINAGSQFADFMLGISQLNQVTSGSGQIYLRRLALAPWFEDSWRFSRKLTITLGLRWDFLPAWTEKNNHIGNIYIPGINGPLPAIPIQAGVNVQGYGQVSDSTLNTNYNNWAPRVGLAYRINDTTVVRAGYGIFYDAQIGNTTVDMVRNPPFQTRIIVTAPDSITPVLSLKNLTPTNISFTSSYFGQGQPENGQMIYPTPSVQQWNFSFQRQIIPNWTVTTSYVGSTGRHLSYSAALNLPYPGLGALNPRRPFNPQITGVFQVALPRSNSYYDGLQVKSEMRSVHGFSMLTSYTYSKSIDTAQEIRAGALGGVQASDNWQLDAQNRGRSAFDQGQRFVNSFVYDVPFGKGKKYFQDGVGAQVLGGWQINSIVTIASGLPFTVYSGVDTGNIGSAGLNLPNVVPGASATAGQTTNHWYNTAAFTGAPDCRIQTVYNTLNNPLVCLGNSGRNIISAPGLSNVDFAVMKNIPTGEFGNLQFRAEFFNLLNTPPLGGPVTTLSSPSAGRILSAGAARQIQFALRYSF
jgi:hypothetical protein